MAETRTPPAAPLDIEGLAEAVCERRAILFAGAGLSMSVGLPSWSQLVAHMAQELELPDELLRAPGATYHAIAEYYRITRGSIGPLRSWMDRTWRVSPDAVRASRLHQLVVELDFPLIYTTNYDRNIETAFEVHGARYVKIASARDLAKVRDDATQIVKFHGDFDDDASLVITETDYFERLAFDSPLDVKLRSDALARTVLFVGYSMTDLNIRLLLHNIWRTWRLSGCARDRPKSYVHMSERNPMQEAILSQWGLTVLAGSGAPPQEALTELMEALLVRVRALREG
ncbi:MAG TPA: SIR2 family protein [Beijerinckiaceae bacterium]